MKKLSQKLKKIRADLTKHERHMFRVVSSLCGDVTDEILATVAFMVTKKKYAALTDTQADMSAIRKAVRMIRSDSSLQKINGILEKAEPRIVMYIHRENKNVYKTDCYNVAKAVDEALNFRTSVSFLMKELSAIENLTMGGVTVKEYVRDAVNMAKMKIDRNLKRNITWRKKGVQQAVLREIENIMDTFKGQIEMILFNSNTNASNQAFYQATVAFSEWGKQYGNND